MAERTEVLKQREPGTAETIILGPSPNGNGAGSASNGHVRVVADTGEVAEHVEITWGESDEHVGPAGSRAEDTVVLSYEDALVEALPELAKLAAAACTRTAVWGLSVGVRTGARLARATRDPQTAAELVQDVGSDVRSYARELLGITDLEHRVSALTPVGDRFAERGGAAAASQDEQELSPEERLRRQGAELLRQSADVACDDMLHPAFGRILGELAPDEGRILRLLVAEGPQPVVDVRAANLIGVGSQLVAENLSMVGMQAGCRHGDRIAAYLGNLQRLGLVCFSNRPLPDPIVYQVLEAQPPVLDAIKATSRAKTVQRRLCLTDFGQQFCGVCFATEYGGVRALTEGED